MEPKRTPRGATGFTLLEMLIAACILSVALVAIQASVIGMQDGVIKARDISLGTRLASEKLAEIDRLGLKALEHREGDFSPEHPKWRWRVEALSSGFTGLTLVLLDIDAGDDGENAVHLEKLIYEQ